MAAPLRRRDKNLTYRDSITGNSEAGLNATYYWQLRSRSEYNVLLATPKQVGIQHITGNSETGLNATF